ncbi:MAG: putative metal-dependent hydrolase [Sphingobacteriales bacterium]|jgi:uncharacterized damage-inducible protein DinB|nr:MAG: putative metal-dependent hydrolase [Sphingobacteriales bacterium]
MILEELKFPIGIFKKPKKITTEILSSYINDILTFPEKLRLEVKNLSDAQLDTQYRTNGWTIRQVVNHCADSHMNSLTRFKLALTEDQPIIKPYYEERWATLADSYKMPIEPALKILEGIHERWVFLLNNLTKKQLERTFVHPEHGKIFRLDENIGFYAWHCNHHLAHITTLKHTKRW